MLDLCPSDGMPGGAQKCATLHRSMNPAPPANLQDDIARSISREDMANLPIRRYEGRVCLVATPQDLEEARADLRQESVVGFDTETRPAFRKGESHLPCLVQAATARAVYLFQLRRVEVIPPLAELLAEARIVKAGVALADDLRALKHVFPFAEKNMLDLGLVARSSGLGQSGVRNLAGILLGFRIPKGTKTSNWSVPQLSAAQITYAATDAWACRELFLRFQSLGLLRSKPTAPARALTNGSPSSISSLE
jgi:ribonuclease D